MKEKNDFKRKTPKGMNQLAAPRHCLHCGYETLEEVELRSPEGRFFIRRLADKSFMSRFFPRQYLLYGWRCIECGYVMWFTTKYLD